MEDAISGLDEIDALIGCSGAKIELAGEILFNASLPLNIVKACIKTANQFNLYISFAGEKNILACVKEPAYPDAVARPSLLYLEEEKFLTIVLNNPVSCAYIISNSTVPHAAILSSLEAEDSTIQRSSEYYYFITSNGINKCSGALRLAEHWGIGREEILAIGNDENDISMLETAGVGVAVANASPKAIAAADWVAPDVQSGGAAEAIRRVVL